MTDGKQVLRKQTNASKNQWIWWILIASRLELGVSACLQVWIKVTFYDDDEEKMKMQKHSIQTWQNEFSF